ncbi:hypothetical protein, partial [Roseibium sp. RKSG952]|uniref:hypothetical protein n=1 Tax=Roseibium sp. RKSG952 TaxID=2529384 RepID=UPI001AD8CCF7
MPRFWITESLRFPNDAVCISHRHRSCIGHFRAAYPAENDIRAARSIIHLFRAACAAANLDDQSAPLFPIFRAAYPAE